MYKSEAQAYQHIRRAWKKRLSMAQRAQNIYMWEVINGTKHLAIVNAVARVMGHVNSPLFASNQSRNLAQKYQDDVSKYQNWLNQYKLEK